MTILVKSLKLAQLRAAQIHLLTFLVMMLRFALMTSFSVYLYLLLAAPLTSDITF